MWLPWYFYNKETLEKFKRELSEKAHRLGFPKSMQIIPEDSLLIAEKRHGGDPFISEDDLKNWNMRKNKGDNDLFQYDKA